MRPRGVCAMSVATAIDVVHISSAPSLPQPLSREGREEAGRFEAEDLLLALLVRLRCVRRVM